MLRRIQIYAFGFLLGSIVVYVTLIRDRDRDLGAWLPEARVKEEVSYRFDWKDSFNTCILKCHGLDSTQFEGLVQNADVNFLESSVKEGPRVYSFEHESLNFQIAIKDTVAGFASPMSEGCPCE